MDIQIRKQLEQLEYIKDKLEYIEYDEALGCYIEKQDGLPTGVAAWVNGAFYGFEQAAKAQAVPEWISVKDRLPKNNILVLAMSQTVSNIFNVYDVMALDEFEEADVTHWMPLPDAPQESIK
ncbi:DUF551 domain-containing protein [Acinetobacter sp. ANC 4216]|uniref:DUF551 domain-containing protein n=1 Tax=Acinetobacter sp. ANC 4216 TaxID=2529840 RepID=UPI00103B2E03|nr:DUF551 domain-containing protein [Acinetobacter sp. ANC 4216]TCB71612.1 DUF551 domain-containing protein [Acinetobacter sp. ANC 4216]